jgi:hypothetical protein
MRADPILDPSTFYDFTSTAANGLKRPYRLMKKIAAMLSF